MCFVCCVCACVRACVRACVCDGVTVCVRVCVKCFTYILGLSILQGCSQDFLEGSLDLEPCLSTE